MKIVEARQLPGANISPVTRYCNSHEIVGFNLMVNVQRAD